MDARRENDVNKLALFVMVKNEKEFISRFIDHNFPIFDESTIVDNGSNDGTLEIIKKYQSNNCRIIECPGPFEKSKICSELMRESNADILFPLDADELLIYDEGKVESASANKTKIRDYLQNLDLNENGSRFKIRRNLQKHPDFDEWWGISNLPKVFYTRKGFISTDAGNHSGEMEHLAIDVESNISLLDHRYFCKEYWEKRTIEKLRARLKDKWNDPQVLVSYRGADMHAAVEYASYLGLRKCIGCKEILPSENFGLGRVMCKNCRPGLKDQLKEGKGVWHRLKKEVRLKL